MPADPDKILVKLNPQLIADLDTIAAEIDESRNRSLAVRWLIKRYLERSKKNQKKSLERA